MGTPLQILVAESNRFPAEAVSSLRQLGRVTLEDLQPAELRERACEADLLWVRLRTAIDAEFMTAAARLQVIASPTTGLNHIDLEAARRHQIEVISLRGETEFLKDVRATAEHTIGLALNLLRHTPAAIESGLTGEWNRDLFVGSEIFGKTIGIVGYGRLGRIVARYFAAFDAEVLVTDPHIDPQDVVAPARWVRLDELLAESDLVTLHVNLSPDATRFFDARKFERMKQGSYLINTSRGEVIDEHALLAALEKRHLTGAAVDVLTNEFEVDRSPMVEYARTHPNLLITPHIGGCTRESMEKAEVFLAQRVVDFFRGSGSRAICNGGVSNAVSLSASPRPGIQEGTQPCAG